MEQKKSHDIGDDPRINESVGLIETLLKAKKEGGEVTFNDENGQPEIVADISALRSFEIVL